MLSGMTYSRWSLVEVRIDLELLVSGLGEELWERKILRSKLKNEFACVVCSNIHETNIVSTRLFLDIKFKSSNGKLFDLQT